MGYDITMIVGECWKNDFQTASEKKKGLGKGKCVHKVAELDLCGIGGGSLYDRIHRHSYSHGKGYWLHAEPKGEIHNATVASSTDTTLYGEDRDREPTAEERFADVLCGDVFRLDNHGNGLRPVPIKEVISLLETEIDTDLDKGETPYRRFLVALEMLRQFKRGWGDELVVLFYAH